MESAPSVSTNIIFEKGIAFSMKESFKTLNIDSSDDRLSKFFLREVPHEFLDP